MSKDNPSSSAESDYEFLLWLRDRLEFVYNESPNMGFVQRVEQIAKKLEPVKTETRYCLICHARFYTALPSDSKFCALHAFQESERLERVRREDSSD